MCQSSIDKMEKRSVLFPTDLGVGLGWGVTDGFIGIL